MAKKRGVSTGYKPQESREKERQREANAKRGAALQAFMARYDAVAILERQAIDWLEGFGAGAAAGGGSNAAAGGRTLAEAIRGMVDHKLNRETNQVEQTTIPLREGHELAERCAAHAYRITKWLALGDRLDRELYALLPKDHPLAEMRARHEQQASGGAGTCPACGRNVPGIRENPTLNIKADRLKANLCYGQPDSCYDAWRNDGGPDKTLWTEQHNKNAHPNMGENEPAGNAPQPDARAVLSDFTGHERANQPRSEAF